MLRNRTHRTSRVDNVSTPWVIAPSPLLDALTNALATMIVLATIVAFAPRSVSAQAATPVQHTVRHTLRGDVGAVTQLALSSPWRPSAYELGVLPNTSSLPHRSWTQRADVRSNVRTVIVLEPSGQTPAGDVRNAWQVVNANGQLVPWQLAPIVLSHELPAGRHDVAIVWVAPPGSTDAPAPVLRLQIVTGAR